MSMASLYMDRGHEVALFAAALWSNAPLGAGLSSSAALEVNVWRVLKDLNGLTVGAKERASIARKCEHVFGGVECGIMDQLISPCGVMNHALFIEWADRKVPIKAPDAVIVVSNSVEEHNLGDSVYDQIVKECRDVLATAVRVNLDPVTFSRAHHVISENERTRVAKDAFRSGDLKAFEKLINESHESLKTDNEVSSKRLNALVDIARNVDGVLGAGMTGAGARSLWHFL